MRWSGFFVAAIAVAEAVGAAPNVVVSAFPRGMVQIAGSGSTSSDTFTITNIGDATASVALVRSNIFFTISSSAATLAPGTSQTITIRGTSQPGGGYVGFVTMTGSGVPASGIVVNVRMMVGGIPAGTVDPQALISRLDISGPADQAHASAIAFRNNGNATMMGMAMSDTSWLAPQQQLLSIDPARNAQVTFTADPTKRPDAPTPLGGMEASLSLRYIAGNGADRTVTVSIVDVVKPGVGPGDPPPLPAGELALFVPGVSSRNQVLTDLFLSARRGEPAITDLKIFFAQSALASTSFLATIAQPPTGLGLWFPSVLQSVFSRGEQVGTLQLRGAQSGNVSVSAVQISTPDEQRFFSSPLPILRSDRGIGPGESVLLTGAEKSGTVATSVYVQEMSGATATAQTEFFDAAGASIGTRRTDSINAFRAVELLDIAPAGARSIRITNTGSTARLGAMALVSDNATQASWAIVDPSRNAVATDRLLMPIVSTSAEVFVANRSTSSATITIDTFVPTVTRRRRAVHANALQTATLRPLETLRTTVNAPNTMLSVSGPAGAISATGKITLTTPGRIGSFGTSLPVVPLQSALLATQGTRFNGVNDGSVSRASLILAEVGGLTATVRVTLRYIFVAGLAVSSQAVSSKDFSVAPGAMLIISDLARTVIGAQRDTFGDLRNIQVDVDVVTGGGRIIPFIQTSDIVSGDISVRAE